jgi:transcriptional regulator of arginine metabolism
MKRDRHHAIMRILETQAVATQEDLAEKLCEMGLDITQATVSRDIKEMGLVKVFDEAGGYRYALPSDSRADNMRSRLCALFRESVLDYESSENIIVIRCLPATAMGVASCLDNLNFEEVLGTVAGDDTIFVVVRQRDSIPELLEKFDSLKR